MCELGAFGYSRDRRRGAKEIEYGIYVIRTSVPTEHRSTTGVITTYKNLAHVERDFRILKAVDLDLRTDISSPV